MTRFSDLQTDDKMLFVLRAKQWYGKSLVLSQIKKRIGANAGNKELKKKEP